MSSLPHISAPPAEAAGTAGQLRWPDVARQLGRRIAALPMRPWPRQEKAEEAPGALDTLHLFERDQLVLQGRFASLQQELRRLCVELAPPGREQHSKIWALTSARSGEGKTTVAGVLAYTLSDDLGQPVLLIEGDLRRPVLAAAFHTPATPGLSDFLSSDISVFQALHETAKPGLWLLPAGRVVDNPTRLLRARPKNELLEPLRKDFAAMIIDVPAVLSSSEAPVLVDWAERSLLVLATGETGFAPARQALELLGARAAGVILNRVKPALPGWIESLLGADGRV